MLHFHWTVLHNISSYWSLPHWPRRARCDLSIVAYQQCEDLQAGCLQPRHEIGRVSCAPPVCGLHREPDNESFAGWYSGFPICQ
jgi:hypothetical protein